MNVKFGFDPAPDRMMPTLSTPSLLTVIGSGAAVSFWMRDVPAPVHVVVPGLIVMPPDPVKCSRKLFVPVKSTVPPVMASLVEVVVAVAARHAERAAVERQLADRRRGRVTPPPMLNWPPAATVTFLPAGIAVPALMRSVPPLITVLPE